MQRFAKDNLDVKNSKGEKKKQGKQLLSCHSLVLEGYSHVNCRIRESTPDEVIEDDCVIRFRDEIMHHDAPRVGRIRLMRRKSNYGRLTASKQTLRRLIITNRFVL